jgi:microcin C transport system substrate-binding protein
MVGFIPNLRREVFQDERVREALNYAFDFETLRRTIFYGQYERIDSFFYGTELASQELPEGRELEILESVKDKIPPEVFTTPYVNPVGGDTQKERENLRTALTLLREAGYELKGSALVNSATGKQLSFEVLLNGPTIETVALPWQANLRKIGIDMKVRSVDTPQWINRVRSRDFDMIYTGWAQSLSPGNEQRDFWGAEAADSPSSRNHAGIADPGVDALIARVVLAKDRDELVAATRALDRVLLAHHYLIPSYTRRKAPVARWDRFARPDALPQYSIGFPTIWWWDEEKAAAIEQRSQ